MDRSQFPIRWCNRLSVLLFNLHVSCCFHSQHLIFAERLFRYLKLALSVFSVCVCYPVSFIMFDTSTFFPCLQSSNFIYLLLLFCSFHHNSLVNSDFPFFFIADIVQCIWQIATSNWAYHFIFRETFWQSDEFSGECFMGYGGYTLRNNNISSRKKSKHSKLIKHLHTLTTPFSAESLWLRFFFVSRTLDVINLVNTDDEWILQTKHT